MTICEFCLHFQRNSKCELGLDIPKGMSCREFSPSLTGFCSNPNDFVSSRQITTMATFFGLKGTELKKVKLMAAKEEKLVIASRAAALE